MKTNQINYATIETAKNIVEELFEDSINPVDFCRKVETWYRTNKSSQTYAMRLAVLAVSVVTGGDMSESCYYAKPTTEEVKVMLPIVEKKMRKRTPLKIVCAEWSRYMHGLFTNRYYGAYTCTYYPNAYDIDMHMDYYRKEVA